MIPKALLECFIYAHEYYITFNINVLHFVKGTMDMGENKTYLESFACLKSW